MGGGLLSQMISDRRFRIFTGRHHIRIVVVGTVVQPHELFLFLLFHTLQPALAPSLTQPQLQTPVALSSCFTIPLLRCSLFEISHPSLPLACFTHLFAKYLSSSPRLRRVRAPCPTPLPLHHPPVSKPTTPSHLQFLHPLNDSPPFLFAKTPSGPLAPSSSSPTSQPFSTSSSSPQPSVASSSKTQTAFSPSRTSSPSSSSPSVSPLVHHPLVATWTTSYQAPSIVASSSWSYWNGPLAPRSC